jgi:hypothetical protein
MKATDSFGLYRIMVLIVELLLFGEVDGEA